MAVLWRSAWMIVLDHQVVFHQMDVSNHGATPISSNFWMVDNILQLQTGTFQKWGYPIATLDGLFRWENPSVRWMIRGNTYSRTAPNVLTTLTVVTVWITTASSASQPQPRGPRPWHHGTCCCCGAMILGCHKRCWCAAIWTPLWRALSPFCWED